VFFTKDTGLLRSSIADFRVIEKTRHEELTDKFAMHFFELPKVPDGLGSEYGIVRWLNLFRVRTRRDRDSTSGTTYAGFIAFVRVFAF